MANFVKTFERLMGRKPTATERAAAANPYAAPIITSKGKEGNFSDGVFRGNNSTKINKIVVGSARGRGEWEPKYEDAAVGVNAGLVPLADEDDNMVMADSVPWEPAPASSHLLAFRFLDARKLFAGVSRRIQRKQSSIEVRFKPSGRRGVTQYAYYGEDRYLESAYNFMLDSDHPGEIIWMFIYDGTSYRRIS